MQILRLAVISPMRSFFDYLPPVRMAEKAVENLQPGIRIRAPFGNRSVVCILLEVTLSTNIDKSRLKNVLEILDETPLIRRELLELCNWAASYYHHPPGEVIAAAFSSKQRRGLPVSELVDYGWTVTSLGEETIKQGKIAMRAPKQASLLNLISKSGFLGREYISNHASHSSFYALKKKKLITLEKVFPKVLSRSKKQDVALNHAQKQVLSSIKNNIDSFKCHVIEGVTGSGKTEIYLQLIHLALKQQKQVLLLIPEINLTPQTVLRVSERFDARITELHSGLTDSDRDYSWRLVSEGYSDIIIGTRSACFAPCSRLGMIIVDEEHDSSYKQQDGFRYSARDIAVKRAQIENCPIVLGSATPSLETLLNVRSDRYLHHELTERVGGASLPNLTTIDIREKALSGGLSSTLLRAIKNTIDKGEQVLLFLNRRGYATQLQCHRCGWIAECEDCDVRMTLHKKTKELRCHHCGKSARLILSCPNCGSKNLLLEGIGTQQTEEKIREAFKGTIIHRVDSDNIPNKAAMEKLMESVTQRRPCILIGTQMLAKGHHFPGVTLVGVLDADSLLFGLDFRGEERMAQLITQVSGRAGRESNKSHVLLQTHHPNHPFMQAIVDQSYSTLSKYILDDRGTRDLPPLGYLILMRADSKYQADGEHFLKSIAERANITGDVKLIGPLPSAMPRRAGKYRNQLLLHSKNRTSIHKAATKLVSIGDKITKRNKMNWFIDVDPVEIC